MYLDMAPIPILEQAKFYTKRILQKNGKKLKNEFKGSTIPNFQFLNIDLLCIIIFFMYFLVKE